MQQGKSVKLDDWTFGVDSFLDLIAPTADDFGVYLQVTIMYVEMPCGIGLKFM
jgi:Ethanolamine utilization protein EutJ (predicted chaperonin)